MLRSRICYHVAVGDNQQLRQGDLLFEIDPADFQA
jgi:multidrug resistance efflux pump